MAFVLQNSLAMGFFNLFHPPTNDTRTVTFLKHLPTVAQLMTSPKAIKHNVSFGITTSRHAPKATRCRALQMPAPIPLPLEILRSIIEEAAFDEAATPDATLLKSCSLVCRSWSLPAQKLLFSSVTLRSEPSYSSFCNAVNRSTNRGCILGDAVVRLRVVMDHNQPLKLSQHSFGRAVTLCPNLFELNISLYGCASPGDDVVGVPDASRMRRPAPSFDEGTLALLRSGPRITALQFSNWSENQDSITQLLDIWPNLKSLTIAGTPPRPPAPFLEPSLCSLEELRMNFQSAPSFDFMDWLLHNSRDTLRILEFEREPSTQLLDHLTDTHGATLNSLSFPSCHHSDYASAVQKCPRLKELRIESGSVPKLWKRIPDTLEHIALGVDLNTSLQPLIDIVRNNDTLKDITVHVSNRGDQHALFPVLKMVCAYNGVALEVMHDIKTFRSQLRGDPVSTSIFPRTRSLNNIYAMRS